MKLVEFVPPERHPLWKLCLQMGITDVVVKVMDHDPETVIADLASAGLRVVGFEGDMFDMSPIKEFGAKKGEAESFPLVSEAQDGVSFSEKYVAFAPPRPSRTPVRDQPVPTMKL